VTRGPAAPALELLAELAPFVRRVAALQATAIVRIRIDERAASAFASLPFGCLAGRSLATSNQSGGLDCAYEAAALIAWIDDPSGERPRPRDEEWRGGLPPMTGWRHLDAIPDDVLRLLVANGATALKKTSPGGRPPADVADALLDSVIATVSASGEAASVTLRMAAALTRLGFLPRGSHANVDVSGRWVRIAGRYGSVYVERPGARLSLSAPG